MEQPTKRLLEFKDHLNSAGYSHYAKRQGQCRYNVVRREQTKTGEKQGQPEDYKTEKRFWSALSALLGQQPACVPDLRGERHRLSHIPLAPGVGWLQAKQQVLDSLQQLICRPIVDADIVRAFRE